MSILDANQRRLVVRIEIVGHGALSLIENIADTFGGDRPTIYPVSDVWTLARYPFKLDRLGTVHDHEIEFLLVAHEGGAFQFGASPHFRELAYRDADAVIVCLSEIEADNDLRCHMVLDHADKSTLALTELGFILAPLVEEAPSADFVRDTLEPWSHPLRAAGPVASHVTLHHPPLTALREACKVGLLRAKRSRWPT